MKQRDHGWNIAALWILLGALGAARVAAQPPCIGDCNRNGEVAVDELITAVSIALGTLPVTACTGLDGAGDGVRVDDLVTAINNAINLCPTEDLGGASASAAASAQSAVTELEHASDIIDFGVVSSGAGALAANVRELAGGHGAGVVSRPCALGGSAESACYQDRFGFTFEVFFIGCADFNAAGSSLVIDGTYAVTSTDPAVCAGETPAEPFVQYYESLVIDEVDVFDNFRHIEANLRDEVQPLGTGCAGLTAVERFRGELLLVLTDSRGVVLIDKIYASDDFVLATSSDGRPCATHLAVNGSLDIDDSLTGDQLQQNFTDFRIDQRLAEDGTVILAQAGRIHTACLGALDSTTLEPLVIAPGGFCPVAGELQVVLPDRTFTTVRYLSDGVDITGDGVADLESCLDRSVSQCPGKCQPCESSSDCPGTLGCFPCAFDCTGTASRCAPEGIFVQCSDGSF